MMLHRHKGLRIQRGHGWGSLLSGLFRSAIVPAAKAGTRLLKTAAKSKTARSLGKQLKNTAVDMAVDALEGRDAKQTGRKSLIKAKKTIAKNLLALKQIRKGANVKGKQKRTPNTIKAAMRRRKTRRTRRFTGKGATGGGGVRKKRTRKRKTRTRGRVRTRTSKRRGRRGRVNFSL